jgi:hypothetical protein
VRNLTIGDVIPNGVRFLAIGSGVKTLII